MRLSVRLFPLLPVVSLVLGCAGERDATEKQLTEMRAEITRLRAAQASLAERLDALDVERGTLGKTPGPASPAPPVAAPPPPPAHPPDRDRPELEVVRLAPSEGDGDADNDPSRPVLRAVGDAGAARQTLSNKTIGARSAPRKGVTAVAKKSPDADPHPVVKP